MAVLEHLSEDQLQFLHFMDQLNNERLLRTSKREAQEDTQEDTLEDAYPSAGLPTKAPKAISQARVRAAQAERRARQAEQQLASYHDALCGSLRLAYEARFGTMPAELLTALSKTSLDQLTAWLPRFAISTDAELLALAAS